MATKTLSLRIDEELIERIDEYTGEGKSRNAVIKELIEAGLDAKAGKKTDEDMLRELMKELIEDAKREISDTVTAGVKAANNELYRDQLQQLAATILPAVLVPLLDERNKQLTTEIEALKPVVEIPQPELEGSETEDVPAETQIVEPQKPQSAWERFKKFVMGE
jgi:metal-responsive CopG/Arc/MetJ family transcriptional regulator